MKVWVACFIFFCGSPFVYAGACNPDLSMREEWHEASSRVQVLEGIDDESLWQPIPYQSTILERFRSYVERNTSTDPSYLIRRQQRIFQNAFPGELILERFELILNELSDQVRPITCLEQFLLHRHGEIRGGSLVGLQSEFGASIIRFKTENRLKIYFVSSSLDGQVSKSEELDRRIESDITQGGTFSISLHNHPFNFDNHIGGDIAGTTIPSGTSKSEDLNSPEFSPWGDIGSYLSHRDRFDLESAWITNGFHTLELHQSDFELF